MAFFRNADELPAKLVHHTGTMVRFTPAQLPHLPDHDEDCVLALPDGRVVSGRFKLNPKNPYIGGAQLVGWIKTWVRWNEPVNVVLRRSGRGKSLKVVALGRIDASARESALQATMRNLAGAPSGARRRRQYTAWERDQRLRGLVLKAWGNRCQVEGCDAGELLPDRLKAALVEVHHLNHVAAAGSDSPLTGC